MFCVFSKYLILKYSGLIDSFPFLELGPRDPLYDVAPRWCEDREMCGSAGVGQTSGALGVCSRAIISLGQFLRPSASYLTFVHLGSFQ